MCGKQRRALGCMQWEEVATRLGSGRTAVQCLQTWVRSSHPVGHATKQRQLWTQEEHDRLVQLAQEHRNSKGMINWVVRQGHIGAHGRMGTWTRRRSTQGHQHIEAHEQSCGSCEVEDGYLVKHGCIEVTGQIDA